MTSIQPELWVDRAAEAVAFYQAAFGAIVLHRVGQGEDIVAQLAIGNAAFWVARAGSAGQRVHPKAVGGATGRTLLVVDDPDAVFGQAVTAGAAPHCPASQRTRLAPCPDHRPVRPSLGNRSSCGRLAATLTETAPGNWQREYGQPPSMRPGRPARRPARVVASRRGRRPDRLRAGTSARQ